MFLLKEKNRMLVIFVQITLEKKSNMELGHFHYPLLHRSSIRMGSWGKIVSDSDGIQDGFFPNMSEF